MILAGRSVVRRRGRVDGSLWVLAGDRRLNVGKRNPRHWLALRASSVVGRGDVVLDSHVVVKSRVPCLVCFCADHGAGLLALRCGR